MINIDIYTLLTLLLSVALFVMAVLLMLKPIPDKQEFAKIRLLRILVVAVFVLEASFAAMEFLYWDEYQFETSMFINLSTGIYQFVICTAVIITCFQPSFTSFRRIATWLGISTLWILPVGILIYAGMAEAVYAAFVAYILQMAISLRLFYSNFRKYRSMMTSTDGQSDINLRWLNMGTCYLMGYCLYMAAISFFPPLVHNIFTVLVLICYIMFADRFSGLIDRYLQASLQASFQEKLKTLKKAKEEIDPVRQEYCRQAVEAWIAAKGFYDNLPDRNSAAGQIGLSKEDLQWYFSTCLKTEFRSWRAKLRIEEAKATLLTNPEISLNELATTLGFQSSSTFFIHFKKIVGETATEFIARHR